MSMKARLLSLTSPDAPDLKRFEPDSPAFRIFLEAEIGPADEESSDVFGFFACSPDWIAQQVATRGFLLGYHHVIVREFDVGLIRSTIANVCEGVAGDDWSSVAMKIARHGAWEFEGYA